MFSFFKKKKVVPYIRLNGVIGNVGKFKQGIDFNGQEEEKKLLIKFGVINHQYLLVIICLADVLK
mgnify:CR=1 FL=1